MIDAKSETIIPWGMASNYLPGQPCPGTLRRWMKGVHGVQLETIKVGGRRFTSVEACERFIAASNQTTNEQEGEADGNS